MHSWRPELDTIYLTHLRFHIVILNLVISNGLKTVLKITVGISKYPSIQYIAQTYMLKHVIPVVQYFLHKEPVEDTST
jgi:hypothetical protein